MKVMKKNDGYVAISVVLVVGFVLVVIGIVVSLTSINEVQSSLSENRKEATIALVEGCIQEALFWINRTNNLPSTVSLPEGSCDVTINSHLGVFWTFTVSGTFENYRKSFMVSANRTSKVTVTSWSEI